MFKQKLIPLASTALLLFSCGNGAKTVKVDIYDAATPIPTILHSEKVDIIVEGTKYNFEIDLSKIEKSVSHMNMFFIGEFSTKSTIGYQILDEESFGISYNGEKLTKMPLTAEYTYDNYFDDVEHNKSNVARTFAIGNADGDNSYTAMFCIPGLQTKDKLSITGTCKNAKSGVQAFYANMPLDE